MYNMHEVKGCPVHWNHYRNIRVFLRYPFPWIFIRWLNQRWNFIRPCCFFFSTPFDMVLPITIAFAVRNNISSLGFPAFQSSERIIFVSNQAHHRQPSTPLIMLHILSRIEILNLIRTDQQQTIRNLLFHIISKSIPTRVRSQDFLSLVICKTYRYPITLDFISCGYLGMEGIGSLTVYFISSLSNQPNEFVNLI